MWDGGNQWSGYSAYLSFFRHVAKLELDYSKWQHYEAAAIHAGPRIMHAEFCMISDRPAFIHRDAQHRPHCETGPFCAWRDGWALYAIHGVRVPRYVVEHPGEITVERIDAEPNAEVRRIMVERYGPGRYLLDSGAREVATAADDDPIGLRGARLYRKEMADDEPLVMVRLVNSTPEPDGHAKEYFLRVHPQLRPLMADGSLGEPQAMTVRNAVASTFGLRGDEYSPAAES